MNLTIKMAKEIETVFKSRNRIKGNQMVKTKAKAEKGGAEKEAGEGGKVDTGTRYLRGRAKSPCLEC